MSKLKRKVVHKRAEGASAFIELVAKEAAALLFTEQEADWDILISTVLKGVGGLDVYVKIYDLMEEKTLKLSYRVGDWQQEFHYSKQNWPYLNDMMMQEIQKVCTYDLRKFLAALGRV